MRQSLPGIIAIYTVSCSLLSPNIVEKYIAGVPVGIFPLQNRKSLYNSMRHLEYNRSSKLVENGKCREEDLVENGKMAIKNLVG